MVQRANSHGTSAHSRSNPAAAGRSRTAPAEEQQEVDLGTVDEADSRRMESYLRGRKAARRIKVGEETEKATSLDEAVVKTVKGVPDMRFAENRNKFMRDQSKKVTGKPDFRFIENRPDIVQTHLERGDDRPNLIFNDEGDIDTNE